RKDDYLLSGISEGQVVTVRMTSSAFAPYIFIIDLGTGAILGETGGATEAQLSFTVQSGISYLVRASSFNDGELGGYQIRTTSP
ncbi:MAG: hypothetical protein AAGJ79_11490, partial [Verrucomicrobiota bacterium]